MDLFLTTIIIIGLLWRILNNDEHQLLMVLKVLQIVVDDLLLSG